MFAPTGAALSVDRLIRKYRGGPGEPPLVLPWAQRMIQIQTALVYLSTFYWKLLGHTWVDGTALYYVLHLSEFKQFYVPGADNPAVIKLMTWSTLAIEFSLGTLVWIRPLRYWVLLAGICLHAAIEYALNIPLFSLTIVASYLNFVDPRDLDAARAWLRGKVMTLNYRKSQAALICLLLALSASAQQQRSLRHYALVLEDPAVGERFTTRAATHSAAAENYRGQIQTRQANLKQELASRKFAVVGAVDTLSNAIFVATTPDRAAELKSLPGVKGVIEMRPVKPRLNAATTLANAPVAWTALGGQSNAGAGIMIGVIGSGIDQTHPAFQDPSLSMPPGFPKCTTDFPADCNYTNNKVIVARSYVRELSAGSSTDPTAVANDSGPDDYSPRDRSGHGTAVASVIAGNQITGPAVPFSGMAPKAWLGNYRVENSPGMPGGGAGQNFESVYIQALNDAFNDGMQIVNLSSGVIATYGPLDTGSVCGQAAGVPCDLLAFNFEQAAQHGMLITVAAGNDGENGYAYFNNGQTGFNLISSPATAPSVIAVGATMNSHVFQPSVNVVGAPFNFQNILAQTSDAYSADVASGTFAGAWTFPVVDAAQAGNDGFACTTFPAFALYNAIALIQQGNCDFNTKATHAANAGALGIIFYMNTPAAATPVETQDSSGNIPLFGPIVMIAQSDGQNLKSYIDAHPGSSVLVDPAGTEMQVTAYNQQAESLYVPGFQPPLAANQLLGFSSPGPVPGTLALKPDIVSTGGSDLSDGPTSNATNTALQDGSFFGANAMYMATQRFDQSSDMYSANGYIAASGTSFSAPMVAGAAALLMQLHPTYTAAQIKALLMNTAVQDASTLGDNWGDNVDALNIGAGRLDVGAATNSPVISQAVTSDGTNPVSVSFGAVTAVPVSKEIQITNLGTTPEVLTVTVSPPIDSNGRAATGAAVTVNPRSVTVAAGASAMVALTVSARVPPAGEYTGGLSIFGGAVALHLPYLLLVPSGVVNDMQAIQFGQIDSFAQGGFETLPNGDGGALQIKLIDASGVPVANAPVSFSVSPPASATLKSVSGHPACTPDSSGSAATCHSDTYGIAWVEVFGGPSASDSPTVTAKAGSMSIPFTGLIINPPKVTGVSESAVGNTSIAAGSYISIYGTNLADTNFVGNNTFLGGDAPTFLPYPMNLDGVTASFDVPGSYDGKPADYNGAPAFFTFVGQAGTQLNVMIPWELQGAASALVKVTVDGIVDSNVLTIPLVTYAPQLFQNGGIAAAIDATTYKSNPTPISATNPAHAGDSVQLYGNGLGPVNNQPASGAVPTFNPLPATKSPCTVTVGGQNAPVSYCGLAGYPAEYQINITVPSGLAAGNQPVVLTTGGVSSKAANLPIK
ncbi:MAG TPA: S8 family serine peptidase [Bryobacteraceae bacterium]|nr:S8 family serine peptidase [Bryobacteraceae bacterium]